ncbi:hypothetical protein M0P65_00075 [Candidatus Gracilibacteria bacterium]|nr:hypothetical protein [Candidatus Gracilibacteria bacterium]
MKYLKEFSYYNDLYDKFTIKECKEIIENVIKYEESKDKPGERKIRSNIYEIPVSFAMVNRALSKKGIIEKRIKDDKEKDKWIESIKTPKIKCDNCNILMSVIDNNILGGYGDEKERILFTYNCEKCNKRKGVYNNGEVYIPKPHLCPKCNIKLKTDIKDELNKTTIIYYCSNCEYKEIDELDLHKKEGNLDFEKDREKFCISEDEAYKLKTGVEKFYKNIYDIINGTDPASIAKKEKDLKYKPLENIKRFTVKELEIYLCPLLEEKGFTNFSLGKAEIDKEIHVYFTIIDKSDKAAKYTSRIRLRKAINDAINNTNWFFMNSGKLDERLGVIQGRLKGVDNNDELLKLIEKRNIK